MSDGDRFPPLEGCGYCGPYCPRCTSRSNIYGWVPSIRHSALLLTAAINQPGNEDLRYVLTLDLPGHVDDRSGAQMLKRGVDAGERVVVKRPNRHDRKRAAAGDYCYCDGPFAEESVWRDAAPEYGPFNGATFRGRRVRTVGEEWALMCRRVQGVVRAATAPDDGLTRNRHLHRLFGGPSLGGRKTQLLRAVAAGGWNPHSGGVDGADGPAVAAIMLRLSHWLRRKRRLR